MHIDISDPINNAEKTCQTVLNISYGLLARARHLCQLLLARHNWNQRKLIRRKLNGHIRVLGLVCVSVCTYKFITPALPVCTHFIYIYWTTCKNTHIRTLLQNLLNFEAEQFEIVKVIEAIRLCGAIARCPFRHLLFSVHFSPTSYRSSSLCMGNWYCKTKQAKQHSRNYFNAKGDTKLDRTSC